MMRSATHCGACGNAFTTADKSCPGCGQLKTADSARSDLARKRKLEAFDPRDALPERHTRLADNSVWSFVFNISAIAAVPGFYFLLTYAQINFGNSDLIGGAMLLGSLLGIIWIGSAFLSDD